MKKSVQESCVWNKNYIFFLFLPFPSLSLSPLQKDILDLSFYSYAQYTQRRLTRLCFDSSQLAALFVRIPHPRPWISLARYAFAWRFPISFYSALPFRYRRCRAYSPKSPSCHEPITTRERCRTFQSDWRWKSFGQLTQRTDLPRGRIISRRHPHGGGTPRNENRFRPANSARSNEGPDGLRRLSWIPPTG